MWRNLKTFLLILIVGLTLMLIVTEMRKQNCVPKQVAVIGGGLAGLSTVYHLNKLTCLEVKLFEKRNRLGGRIQTGKSIYSREALNLGAEFIDSNQNEILHLIKDLNKGLSEKLELYSWEENDDWTDGTLFFKNSNGQMNSKLQKELIELFFEKEIKMLVQLDKVRDAVFRHFAKKGDDADRQLVDRLEKVSIKSFLTNFEWEQPPTQMFYDYIELKILSTQGKRLEELSSLKLLEAIDILFKSNSKDGYNWIKTFASHDEKFRLKGGTIQLINTLAKQLDPKIMNMNHRLLGISGGDRYQLTFSVPQGTKVLNFDYVILTLPVYVFGKIKFENIPNFPLDQLREIVSNTHFTSVAKIFLHFDKPVWRDYKHFGVTYHPEGFTTWSASNGLKKKPPIVTQVIYVTGQQARDLASDKPNQREDFAKIVVDRFESLWPGSQQSYQRVRSQCRVKNGNKKCPIEMSYWGMAYSGAQPAGKYSGGLEFKLGPVGGLYFGGTYFSDRHDSSFMNGAVKSALKSACFIKCQLESCAKKSCQKTN